MTDFRILGKRRKKLGHGKVIYNTTEGDLSADEVAARIGISKPALNSRIRYYGLKDPQVIHGAKQKQSTRAKTKDQWEGLGGKVRNENLKPLPGAGSWEKENL